VLEVAHDDRVVAEIEEARFLGQSAKISLCAAISAWSNAFACAAASASSCWRHRADDQRLVEGHRLLLQTQAVGERIK
jgi:hypothetical protein